MADLSSPRPPDEPEPASGHREVTDAGDRGQLIVVGALALGALLVALVLLVNTTIYAENLATRNPDVGDEEALAYRISVVDGVGGIVDRQNAQEYDDYGALTANVSNGTGVLGRQLLLTHVELGVLASLNQSTVEHDEGRLVRQDEQRHFTDAQGLPEWILVSDTNGTRRFEGTVVRSSLTATNASNIEAAGLTADGAFYLSVTDNATSDTWRVYVYENSSTGNLSVAVKPATTTAVTEVCSVDAATATVGFTEGTLDGERCAGYQWGENVSGRYDLAFSNGDRADGTYNLTVRVEDDGLLSGTLVINDGTATSDPAPPYRVPAVYSVELRLRYASAELEYATTVRIAPGEPDD
jgi:hypothetical protein